MTITICTVVALRKESVDRNHNSVKRCLMSVVALRKESVDRNYIIKITGITPTVALRKESVDRNNALQSLFANSLSRSPQGERG